MVGVIACCALGISACTIVGRIPVTESSADQNSDPNPDSRSDSSAALGQSRSLPQDQSQDQSQDKSGRLGLSTLDLINLPMNEPIEIVQRSASVFWGSQAVCTTIKTGVGLTRRSFLLERCRYTNATQQSLCGLYPETAVYHFLEGKLVQFRAEFANAAADNKLAGCVSDRLLSARYRVVAGDGDGVALLRYRSSDDLQQVTLGGYQLITQDLVADPSGPQESGSGQTDSGKSGSDQSDNGQSVTVSLMPLAARILGLRGTL